MKHRRTIKLILPGLQLKLIVMFVSLNAVAMLLQYVLLLRSLTQLAGEMPQDGLHLLDELGPLLGDVLALTAFLVLPLTIAVGLLATHRFSGPIYRFQVYLRQVIAGEKPADCRLRKDDELQELCGLINQATAPLRSAAPVRQTPAQGNETPLRAAG